MTDDPRESLRRARELIDASYHLPLDIPTLAGAANFSPFHFIRLFRRAFATTPHRYLVRRRLEAARDMLRTTDLSVTEVCFAVGFESLGSFSTLFRRQIGYPPTAERVRIFPGVALWRPFVPACFVTMLGLGLGPGAPSGA